MAGTTFSDLSAITLTASAKAAAATHGVHLDDLMALAKTRATEFTALLKQIVSVHPTTGGDAANAAALTSIINELS
jgi:hypothetical protein